MDFGYLQEAARDDTGDDPTARGFYNPRVKVYRLNDDGKWVDKGTGHVSVEYLERLDAVGLVVIDEEDSKTLLIHRISSEEIYQRQEETIISWTDPEVSTDLALSFQETMGCNYIWEQVCSVQRQIQFPSVGLAEGPRQLSEELEHSGTSQEEADHFPETTVNDSVELPRPELSNLPQLAKIVSEVSPFHRERVASLMTRDPTYLKRLLDLFRFSEDLENTEGLHLMYKIVKGIIMLNDNSIFEIIFRDDCIMDIVGALEYDPEAPKKQEHRQYLKEQVLFKEAVPIRDPNTLSKIHQTYRIGYIKDVILPRALDDQTFGTLNSLMLFNHVEVISSLQNDRTFLGELFAALRARQDTDPSWQDIVYFLQEFCTLARHLQPQQRNHLYQSLIIAGLFEIGSRILQSPDEKLRLAGSDILMCTLTHDPASLRNFLADPKGKPLFGQLIKGMLTPSEGGLQAQLLEMMRMLLDSDSMEATEKSSFLDLFYDDFIEQLVATLVAGCKTGKEAEDVVTKHVVGRPMGSKSIPVKLPVEESLITAETLNHICELLTFCVQHHSFRIKYYVLRNNVVEKVLRLTRRRERYLVVAAIRFLRTCIGLKDDFYARYLIKNNLFAPVVEAFKANGDKYNMLNSAVIEMVDYIRKENMKALVCHLWETFGDFFSSVSYVDTFQNLQVKYNQILDGAGSQAPPMEAASRALGGLPGVVRDADHGSQKLRGEAATGRAAAIAAAREMQMRRRRDGSMDQDEEAYFNCDGDDEDESEHHINARIDQLRGGPPLIEGPPLPQPTANGGEPNSMGMRNPFGLVDYEDEDEESPPGSSGVDGGNGPNSGRQEGRQDGHQQGPHLWPGGQQRTGIWGDGMALKRGPLLREGALGFPNGSNYDRGPLRVAKRVSPGRDHGPRRAGREMELALDREEYEEKMKRRRMMQAKANGEAAFEEQRRSARERGWKSARSKWREHLLKRERHAMDGLRPGNLHPLEEEASQTLQGLGERVLGQRNEPHCGGEGGNVHESPERLGMRMMQSGEMIQPETAQDILMGVDLPNMDAIEACDPGGGAFNEETQGGGLGVGGPVSSNSGEGLPTEQSVNQILLEQPDPAGENDAGARSQEGPQREREEEGAGLKEGGPGEWQGDLDFQGDFSNAKEPDSLKAKLDSEQAPSQELLEIGSDLARNHPTPEPYEVR